MKKYPLVSIIIPTYNYANYISEAIDSAISQTYQNIEIIVVDDGSTDNTQEIVANYRKKLHYFLKENSGAPDTRNFGVKKAKGEFVLFLDADNILDKDYVTKTYDLLCRSPNASYVYTQMRVFGNEHYETNFPEFNLDILKYENYIDACSLISRQVFEVCTYNKNMLGLQDWDFYLSLAEKGIHGKLLNQPLLNYRKHGQGITDRIIDKKIKRNIFNKIFLRHWKLYPIRHVIGFAIGTFLVNTNIWDIQRLP